MEEETLKLELKQIKEKLENLEKNHYTNLNDIKVLFGDYQRLKEMVIDIKNSIDRSVERQSLRLDQVTEDFKALIETKKDIRIYLFMPMLVAIISGVVIGLFFKFL